jgi:RNA polymerase nonessential primary-like sigma factor
MSLDIQVGEEKETSLKDIIEDTNTTYEKDLIQKSISDKIKELLSCLSPQQQEILVLRFGLNGKKLSYAQIGKIFGLSRERIRQIEKRTLAILRRQNNFYKI